MEAIIKSRHKEKQQVSMTSRQIKKKVGEAWAFLENPVYERGRLVSANLLYYDTDKSKVLEQIPKHKKGHFAMFFFGTMDADLVYLL